MEESQRDEALRRIGFELLTLAERRDIQPFEPSDNTAASIELAHLARTMYKHRCRRSEFFPELKSSDGGWYLLLELFASEREGRDVSVTSASLATLLPSSTGLRQVALLEELKLIKRIRCGRDGRRYMVRLTRAACDRLSKYLASLL